MSLLVSTSPQGSGLLWLAQELQKHLTEAWVSRKLSEQGTGAL